MELSRKKILVTGGSGFLGSALIEELRAHWCDQIASPDSNEFDIRESKQVQRLYEMVNPDVVFHLAAVVGGIGANRKSPGKFFYDNAKMGLELMEYGRRHGIEKFIAVGTVCSYPKFSPVPFKEENLWEGYPEETNAPYGLAKKMLLVQSMAYRAQYNFNSIFLLPVNLYGPGDNFDPDSSHVIPAIIQKIHKAMISGNSQITLWGDGTPTREFLYVKDAAQALRLAAENYDSSDPVNIGSGREISIMDLAEKIANKMGFKGSINWDTTKPNGQPRRCLDTSKSKTLFGFEAQTDFEEGLKDAIEWYLDNCE